MSGGREGVEGESDIRIPKREWRELRERGSGRKEGVEGKREWRER